MTDLALRIARLVCAPGAFGSRPLDASDIDRVAKLVDAEIQREIGPAERVSCACCEYEAAESDFCRECHQMVVRASLDDGRVIRSRCAPVIAGAPACGRIYAVRLSLLGRCGVELVETTHGVCGACRESARQYIDARTGGIDAVA